MNKDLPNEISKESINLKVLDLNEVSQVYLTEIEEKGYEVHLLLTEQSAKQIITMSREPDILEYCPNDAANRFKDIETAKTWVGKKRAMVTLMKKNADNTLALAGYGWVGHESDPHAKNGTTTWAVRIGEDYQGQKLATPFCALIVFATAKIYGLDNYWLATWASNPAAVHIYHKLGFIDVNEVSGTRQDLMGNEVSDKRIYMELPNSALS
jgi:ribosomal protein S18 acetylase RimI-like enzyme